jgi:hypothetical protein
MSSGLPADRVWIGGVKKKFSATNEAIDAASPATSPPMAAAAVTATT